MSTVICDVERVICTVVLLLSCLVVEDICEARMSIICMSDKSESHVFYNNILEFWK